jgi:hypothetical protein
MKPKYSLPYSQVLATCPYPEPDQSSPYPNITFCRSILILSSNLCLGFPSGLFSSGFPTETIHATLPSPIHATCPAHIILLYLITRIMFGKVNRSLRSHFGEDLINVNPKFATKLPQRHRNSSWIY